MTSFVFFGVNKSELAIAEGAGFPGNVIGNRMGIFYERVLFRLKLDNGFTGIFHIESDEHDPFTMFLNPLGHWTVRRCRCHQFKTHTVKPVTGNTDLFRLILIRVVRL